MSSVLLFFSVLSGVAVRWITVGLACCLPDMVLSRIVFLAVGYHFVFTAGCTRSSRHCNTSPLPFFPSVFAVVHFIGALAHPLINLTEPWLTVSPSVHTSAISSMSLIQAHIESSDPRTFDLNLYRLDFTVTHFCLRSWLGHLFHVTALFPFNS